MIRRRSRLTAILSALALVVLGLAIGITGRSVLLGTANAQGTPPSTTLGIWNGSPGSVPDNQHPDILNDYLYYGSPFPSSFASAAEAKGATAFVEMEPWQGGGTSDCSSLNGSDSYYTGIGSAIKAGGKPVALTWGHEFAVSGQYPWAIGNGCGFTTANWIANWKKVVTDVRSTAGGLAYFMWAPNADTCPGQSCSTHNPDPWWPGASYVDMTGVDGYPAFCDCGTFAKLFAPTFAEIKSIPDFSSIPQQKIFVAETDFAPLDGSGYESVSGFIKDMCQEGGDGFLEFQDGTPAMSSQQWTEADAALAANCSSTPSGSGTPTATATSTSPTATPTQTQAASGTTPLPTALANQGLVTQFDPATLASSAWNPTNNPGNCPTTNNNAKVNGSGYAEIDTNGATNDCRSIQSPQANLSTAPGTTYEALMNFSSFHDWPALWMYGPNWPNQGEIDAVEGGPGSSSVTWHQSGNYTIGPDSWDNRVVPFASGGSNIQPGVWTTVDISFTTTGVDVYYQGKLYVHIPESVTTSGNDPMFLTISEGSCNSDGTNVCNGGTSPAGSVQTQWVREFKAGAGGGTPTPTPTATTPTPTPTPTPTSTGGSTSCFTAKPSGMPSGFNAQVTGSQVTVNWSAMPDATEYEIATYTPDGNLWRENVTTVPQGVYDSVPTTGTYTYKVLGINNMGLGSWSDLQSFTVTQ